MTEQVHEFEILVHALGESDMVLPEKFRVMSVIEKLPKFWEEFALSLKRQKGEITWTNFMLDISVQEQRKSKQGYMMHVEHGSSKANVVIVGQKSKDCPSKKAKKVVVVAQANTVLGLGTTSGPVANMVVGEVVASRTDDGVME
ncbi:uncharacterized protein LOC141689337 [Apium graveolens]|uniref:uncharacterized protein LOC141689337 n=1 Tax=Apium graveolens TaxID=4045 RepID=UPI003D78F528